jgi:uncharacterized iron-regulated membrane protein
MSSGKNAGLYRSVWRWHFYAGLFAVPFILWLSVTGSIYLFRPQIERYLDRSYDALTITGPRATAAAQATAAIAAIPGSHLHFYELPQTPHSATRILVTRGREEFRVYIHPQTLAILHTVREDSRPMAVLARLHGQLLLGDTGSIIVELAASWAIVLVITGLYLWWPRQGEGLAGVLYIRMRQGTRLLWRDLHAVTGIWISVLALFLMLTGLPWAKAWGGYFKAVRSIGKSAPNKQDWTTSRSAQLAERAASNNSMPGMDMSGMNMAGMDMEHMDHHGMAMMHHTTKVDLTPLDRVITTVAPLQLSYPVLISPPKPMSNTWAAKSDAQNRPLRSTLSVDGTTGTILHREDFQQRLPLDRIMGTGIAAHEGQLFGLANQLLGLITALGLILLSISAIMLWWRRRAVGVLGAPLAWRSTPITAMLVASVIALGIYLPIFGASLLTVLFLEWAILRRLTPVAKWLGLRAAHS